MGTILGILFIIAFFGFIAYVNKSQKKIEQNQTEAKKLAPRYKLDVKGDTWYLRDSFMNSKSYSVCDWYQTTNYNDAVDKMQELETKHKLACEANKTIASSNYEIVSNENWFNVIDSNDYYSVLRQKQRFKEVTEAIEYVQKAESNLRLAEMTNNGY